MNVIITIAHRHFILPQADAIKIMTAMSKAVEVETKLSGEWNDRLDYRVRYIAQRHRSRVSIDEVDEDQIIIPPEIADEVSPAPSRKIRKQIGKPTPQLPFSR
jgi:hypothetical protein